MAKETRPQMIGKGITKQLQTTARATTPAGKVKRGK